MIAPYQWRVAPAFYSHQNVEGGAFAHCCTPEFGLRLPVISGQDVTHAISWTAMKNVL